MHHLTSRLLVPLLSAVALAACMAGTTPRSAAPSPQGGAAASAEEGASFEHAIVLADARNEFQGVGAEHKWVRAHYPGWSWDAQYLVNHEGRIYDLIELSRGSERRRIYFDITDWFGHLE